MRPLIVLENIAMMRNLEEVTIVTGDYSSISALLSERSLPNFVRESRETRRKLGETSKNVTNCKQMLLSFTQDF